MEGPKFLSWFSNFILSNKVRKLSKDVVQLRAELEVFETDVSDKLIDTLKKLSKRIQTRNAREESKEEELDTKEDAFDEIRKLNKGKDTKIGI